VAGMVTRIQKIIVAAFLLTFSYVMASAQVQGEASLSLKIAPETSNYVEGEGLPIRFTVTNVSKQPIAFTLADNDKDPPGFIAVRVWDSDGNLLTRNDTLKDGWWTFWVLWSSTYKEKPSDRISLLPGEKYSRTVSLRALLAGCPGLPSGLKGGTYRLQLEVGADVSDEIEITINPKSQPEKGQNGQKAQRHEQDFRPPEGSGARAFRGRFMVM
jgi:hypothetical protein